MSNQDQLVQDLLEKRQALADLMNENDRLLERITAASEALAVAQFARMEYGSEDLAKRALTAELIRGADDVWSGRGNDAKRAAFDGLRAAAQKLIPTH